MADNTTSESLDSVAKWLGDESGFAIDDADVITVDGDPPLMLQVTEDEQRVVITYVASEAGAGAGRADAVISTFPDRGTTLHAAAAVDRSGVTITVTNHVYVDGFNRQAFMNALNELVTGVETIGTAAVAETRVHEPVTSDTAEAAAEPVAVKVPQKEAASEPATTTTGAWAPTHKVPAAGMQAWADPNPSQQPSARLAAGVELTVAEKRGDWAHVVGSNGWTGWVDARRIEAIGAAAATGGTGSTVNLGGFQLRPLPLVGAAALLLAAFLPWVSAGASVNSLDVALSFLWDLNAAGSPYLGWVIIGLAVVALALAAAKEPNPQLITLVGFLAVAITGTFLIQMYRGITDSGGELGDVFDFLGIAPWVSLGAGVLIIAGAKK